MKNSLMIDNEIKNKIYLLRGVEVMFDRDLAKLYQVETKVLNQAVKRNIDRFPVDFMFQLNTSEFENWRSQFVTSKSDLMGLRRAPYVFTEQGVSMLASVLKSKIAIEVSIQIIRTFVNFRKLLSENVLVFHKIEQIEQRLSNHDKNIEMLLSAELPTKEGIYYDGQIFDAYTFVSKIIKSAKQSIVLIDNYVDDTILTLLLKREKGVAAKIYTHNLSKQLKLDLSKHNQQYPEITIKVYKKSHDRFIILDNEIVYHIGASLKDLGKKWFAFSKININVEYLLEKLK